MFVFSTEGEDNVKTHVSAVSLDLGQVKGTRLRKFFIQTLLPESGERLMERRAAMITKDHFYIYEIF